MLELSSKLLALSELQYLSKVEALFILLDKDVFLELKTHFFHLDLTKIYRFVFLKKLEHLLQLLLTDRGERLFNIVPPLLLVLFLPRLHLLLQRSDLEHH